MAPRRAARHRPIPARPAPSLAPGACEPLEARHAPAVFAVTTLDDAGAGSLRDAVERANARPGIDTVRFAAGLVGTLRLTGGEITIRDTLGIDGPASRAVTVSGAGVGRIFSIVRGTAATLDDLVLADGLADRVDPVGPGLVRGGAIRNDGGHLALRRVDFQGNRAVAPRPGAAPAAGIAGGGAVVNSGEATLVATDCTFTDNEASGGTTYAFGGAIANVTGSRTTLVRCTFIGNRVSDAAATYGGAVGNFGGSRLEVRGGSFVGNEAGPGLPGAPAGGGAIATRPGTVSTSGSTTLVDGTRFIGNRAVAGGEPGAGGPGGSARGGALSVADSSLIVRRSIFDGNEARGGPGGAACGGAIDVASVFGEVGPRVRLGGSSFLGNRAVGAGAGPAVGGAVSAGDGTTEIDRSTFSVNVAHAASGAAAGGALAVGFTTPQAEASAARLVVRFSRVTGNRATAGAGGSASGGGIHAGNVGPGAAPDLRTVATRQSDNLPRVTG